MRFEALAASLKASQSMRCEFRRQLAALPARRGDSTTAMEIDVSQSGMRMQRGYNRIAEAVLEVCACSARGAKRLRQLELAFCTTARALPSAREGVQLDRERAAVTIRISVEDLEP